MISLGVVTSHRAAYVIGTETFYAIHRPIAYTQKASVPIWRRNQTVGSYWLYNRVRIPYKITLSYRTERDKVGGKLKYKQIPVPTRLQTKNKLNRGVFSRTYVYLALLFFNFSFYFAGPFAGFARRHHLSVTSINRRKIIRSPLPSHAPALSSPTPARIRSVSIMLYFSFVAVTYNVI